MLPPACDSLVTCASNNATAPPPACPASALRAALVTPTCHAHMICTGAAPISPREPPSAAFWTRDTLTVEWPPRGAAVRCTLSGASPAVLRVLTAPPALQRVPLTLDGSGPSETAAPAITTFEPVSLRRLLASPACLPLLAAGVLFGAALSALLLLAVSAPGVPSLPAPPLSSLPSSEPHLPIQPQQQGEEEAVEVGGGRVTVYPGRVLGRSPRGTVVCEGRLADGRRAAVKQLVRGSAADAASAAALEALAACGEHENVLRCYARVASGTHVFVAAPLCCGNLVAWVAAHPPAHAPTEEVSPEARAAMRDMAAGLRHLHAAGLAHGALSPQNVLYDAAGRLRLADLAPQPAPSDLPSAMAADIRALGSLFHYVLTGVLLNDDGDGHSNEDDEQHQQQQQNTVPLLWGKPMWHSLVRRMVTRTPPGTTTTTTTVERPSAAGVCAHPVFWSARRRLAFLAAASDVLEAAKAGGAAFAANYDAVLGTLPEVRDWHVHCHPALLADLSARKHYDHASAADLLRVVRNKAAHYHDLPPPLRAVLGPCPDGLLAYFDRRFPSLFICTYEYFRHACREPAFSEYFLD